MLAEVLRAYLVRCGYPQLREALASRLASEGMTPDGLTRICEAVASRGKPDGETAALIGRILADDPTTTSAGVKQPWHHFLEDLGFAADRKADVVTAESAAAQRNMAGMDRDSYRANEAKWMGMTLEEYDRWHLEKIVAARINWDRSDAAVVAQDSGLTVEEVEAIAAHHLEMERYARAEREAAAKANPIELPPDYAERKKQWDQLRTGRGMQPLPVPGEDD